MAGGRINILIVTPAKRGSNKGNRITADRWASILRTLRHKVTIAETYSGGTYDLLIALHARKSAKAASDFRSSVPMGRLIVAMTGTDLHCDLGKSKLVDQSLKIADRIVLLEPQGGLKLSSENQRKSRVFFQSSIPVKNVPAKLTRFFEVSVLGHLRAVKDPFCAAQAARLLPDSSRIRVVHFGQALTAKMKRMAEREMQQNPRYRWLGSVPHGEAQRRLARSRLTVLSSESEGGPTALSEAIVNRVPILATRIDATIGMLGNDFPGFFEVGDRMTLAELMTRAESDSKFYRRLISAGAKQKPKFMRRREIMLWKSLLEEIE